MLSAALDSGVAMSVLVIFFCLQFPKSGTVCCYFVFVGHVFSFFC